MSVRSRSRLAVVGLVALLVAAGCSSSATTAPTAAPATPAPATAAPSEAATPAPSAASVNGKKVAWVAWGNDGYQQGQTMAFKKLAEADGAQVTIIDGKNDPLVQAKAIDDLIAAKIDGIVWQPVDPAAALEPAKRIRAAGIPMVFVGAKPDKASGITAPFLPFNSSYDLTKQAGAAAAKFVTETLKQTPKVVLYDLLNLPLCHEERMQGFWDGITSVAPDAQKVFWDTVPTTKDGTMSKMEDQLQANPDFNIFSGCGGDLILGGVAGLQAAGRAKAENKVPKTEWILTIDGTPAEIALLLDKNSSVEMTMTLTPYENGEATWGALRDMLNGTLASDADQTIHSVPGLLLTPEMGCDAIAKIYEKEYGLTQIYKPIDCSKMGG
jgi:ribose transport system substrate-binding protein